MSFGNKVIALSSQRHINIVVFIDGQKFHVTTYQGEYRSLMVLLYDKFYLDGFGECKGTGRCGTCHIRVLSSNGQLPSNVGNEITTLSKMISANNHSRLSCQMILDETMDGLVVEVVSES